MWFLDRHTGSDFFRFSEISAHSVFDTVRITPQLLAPLNFTLPEFDLETGKALWPVFNENDDYAGDASTDGEVAIGGSTSGINEEVGDDDWFAVSVEAGVTYHFDLNQSQSAITLVTADGTVLGNGSQDIDRNRIEFTATETTTLYLSVMTDDIDLTGLPVDFPVNYIVSAATASTQPPDIAGDSSTDASIAVGSTATSFIDFDQDDDWFRVNLEAGVEYTLPAISDITFSIYGSDGFLVQSGLAGGALTFSVPSTGEYFVSVLGSLFGDPVSYTVQLLEFPADIAGDDSTSASLVPDTLVNGAYNFENDTDWYRFSLTEESSVIITVGGQGASSGRYTIYDVNGNEVSGIGSSVENGVDTISVADLPAGDYFFEARGIGINPEPYTVELTIPGADDVGNSADDASPFSFGSTINAVIDTAVDTDWFQIEVTDLSRTVIIDVMSDIGLTLRFWDDAGNILTDIFGQDGAIGFSPAALGTYFIEVSSNSEGNYSLFWNNTVIDLPSNNNTSGVIANGDVVTGTIDFFEDRDWYAIDVTRGEQVIADLTALAGAITGVVSINVIYPNGLSLFENMLDLRDVGFFAGLTGTYYIEVIHDTNSASSVPFDYELFFETRADDYGSTADTAGSLAPGERNPGLIDGNGDTDWFAMNLVAGQEYFFQLDTYSLNATINLIDSGGNVLTAGRTQTGYHFEATSTGTFFVEVSSDAFSDLNDNFYEISAEGVTDFGGNISTNGRISAGETVSGYLTQDDVQPDTMAHEWFRFDASAGDTIFFAVNAFSPNLSGQLINVEIRDSSGNFVGTADQPIEFLQSGTFYVALSGFLSSENYISYDLLMYEADNFTDGTIIGAGGNDLIFGGDNVQEIRAGNGNNFVRGDNLDNHIFTGTGNDVIEALAGSNLIFDGGGSNTIRVGDGMNEIYLYNDGDDFVETGFGSNAIILGGGNDTAISYFGDDVIYGQDGDDDIRSGDGVDRLFGGAGNDRLFSGNGDDVAIGDIGIDIIRLGAGNDTGYGGADNDLIDGSAGNDTIFGETGDDEILGGSGFDVLIAGAGNDLVSGGSDDDTIYGQDGSDILSGDDGNDTIFGEAGDDILNGGNGIDVLVADAGDGTGNDTANGGNGNDVIYTFGGSDTIDGGGGNDTIFAGIGDDIVNGGAGDDVIAAEAGDDLVDGGDGADVVNGLEGNDRMTGGAGDNLVLGGTGADVFFNVEGGIDRILDFETGIDMLELRSLANMDALISASTEVGADLVINDGGTLFVLSNYSLSSIKPDDFEFVTPTSAEKTESDTVVYEPYDLDDLSELPSAPILAELQSGLISDIRDNFGPDGIETFQLEWDDFDIELF